jgi:hypothetical protein
MKLNPLTVIVPVFTTMWLEERARLRGATVGVGRAVGEAVGEAVGVGVGLGAGATTWRVAEP